MSRACSSTGYIHGTTSSRPAAGARSLAVWASHNSTADLAAALAFSVFANADNNGTLYFRGDLGSDPVEFRDSNGVAGGGGANSTTGYSASTITHIGGSNAAGGGILHSVYRNGASKGTATFAASSGPIDRITIGCTAYSSTYTDRMTGDAAMAAVWEAELSDAEFVSLANGFPPRRVRPQSLIFYAPLLRQVFDWRGLIATLTDAGTSVADHPRSYGF